jgi:hypothetical protein
VDELWALQLCRQDQWWEEWVGQLQVAFAATLACQPPGRVKYCNLSLYTSCHLTAAAVAAATLLL